MALTVVKSPSLTNYKLTNPLRGVLSRQSELDEYMKKAGHKLLPFIRLYRHDYVKIDHAIRKESEGEYDITKVLFHGRKVICVDQPEPPFVLESQP